jgi:(2Fe-2S) ferredoxin
MKKPKHHIFICNSYRVSGEPQGVCNKKGATGFLQYVEEGILDRGLDAMVSSTGCLKVCDRGPAMVVYPQGWWYGDLSEDRIDEILDAMQEGKPVEEYLLC